GVFLRRQLFGGHEPAPEGFVRGERPPQAGSPVQSLCQGAERRRPPGPPHRRGPFHQRQPVRACEGRDFIMYPNMMDTIGFVSQADPELGAAMGRELSRQRQNIELIASENIVSPAVMAAMGSVLTNKYAEGYPGHRYYGGCVYVDEVENIAIRRACQLFGAKYANVQPHSGAQANLAVYFALLDLGDTVMGMDLSQGGHLTHG